MKLRPQTVQVIAAIGALLIGVLVYLIDRPPGSVYLIPEGLSVAGQNSVVFGVIGNHLPTLVHVYAFIILTAVIMAPSPNQVMLICVIWFLIDALFELAQIDAIAKWLVSYIPSWFEGIPVLENTSNFFSYGTFDILDILSITIGAIAAYFTIDAGKMPQED